MSAMSAISAIAKSVVSLENSSQPVEDMQDRVLVFIRNMAGVDVHVLAVKKTAVFWDMHFHVSEQMGLITDEVKLMWNYEKPCPLARIGELQSENNEIVIQLLVEKRARLKHWYFECPNCQRQCDISDCVDWSEDPSERCNHPDHTSHMCCYADM